MHFTVRGKSIYDYNRTNSEYKQNQYEKRWTKLLLKWLTKCVNTKYNMKSLTTRWPFEILEHYKTDVFEDYRERALMDIDDVEPFFRYRYPMLRLKTLNGEQDLQRKLYIMTSVLLYHCCLSSQTGRVERELHDKLTKAENDIVLEFCRNLSGMEVTIGNVDNAIQRAIDFVETTKRKSRSPSPHASVVPVVVSNAEGKDADDNNKYIFSKTGKLKIKIKKKLSPADYPSTSLTIMPEVNIDPPNQFQETSDYNYEVYNDEESPEDESAVIMHEHQKEEADNLWQRDSDSQAESDASDIDENHVEAYTAYSAENFVCSNCTRIDAFNKSMNEDPFKRTTIEAVDSPDTLPCRCMASKKSSDEGLSGEDEKDEEKPTGYRRFKRLSLGQFWTQKVTTNQFPNAESKPSYDTYVENLDKMIKEEQEQSKKSIPPWAILILTWLIFMIVCGAVGGILYSYYPKMVKNAGSAISQHLHNIMTMANNKNENQVKGSRRVVRMGDPFEFHAGWAWQCKDLLCLKVYRPRNTSDTFGDHSRCILLCSGPMIWPMPIGSTYFNKKLVAVTTEKLEYKFETVESSALNQYLGEAFKYFLQTLDTLERMEKNKSHTSEKDIKKLSIQINVETDPDPRIRVNTDESYYLSVDLVDDKVKVKIKSPSFAGARHALETVGQVILIDQTAGHLITLSSMTVKDGPTYRYRGLMLDTARNFIPVPDILRTLDGMASCKLNTFHWRVSDATSFPLQLDSLPELATYGAYDKSMIYSKADVSYVVHKAKIRGIRVLLEIAFPGPVGRAWSWSKDATCPTGENASTCDNMLCVRLKISGNLFNDLQNIYAEIIEMTGVDDVFHLSNSFFSLAKCSNLHNDRAGFLDMALKHLRLANKGFLPELPIIWYTPLLENVVESRFWDRYGVQLLEWPSDQKVSLSKYKVIHSSKWDLSCEVQKQRCIRYRSWQEMYSWRSWGTIESLTVEGGEAILWSDLVDSGNLDAHLWPRAAAVAERLWSDLVLNSTATGDVYLRLDLHRRRMVFLGLKVEPIWPAWCSNNPHACIAKVQDVLNNK